MLNSRLLFLQRITSAIWQTWIFSQFLSLNTIGAGRGRRTYLSYMLFSMWEARRSEHALRGSFAVLSWRQPQHSGAKRCGMPGTSCLTASTSSHSRSRDLHAQWLHAKTYASRSSASSSPVKACRVLPCFTRCTKTWDKIAGSLCPVYLRVTGSRFKQGLISSNATFAL